MPYPMSSSKGYSGSSTGLGYSTIPSMSMQYMPGLSSMVLAGHNFSSGRSPLYGGSSGGSSLGLLSLSSYSMPYMHVSPYGGGSSSYGGYGGYTSSPKSYLTQLAPISEHSSGSSPAGKGRRIPRTYIPVMPMPSAAGNRPALYSSSGVKTLFTEDIDVSTPRKPAKPAEITRKRSSEGYGTIRRGRTVIRLETKKLKENPYLPPAAPDSPEQKGEDVSIKEPEVLPPEATTIAVEDASTKPVPISDETNPQLSKDYSQVAKWYEEEMRKPMKKEKNAGDKFREKYMVHSRKHKYAGYRRPTLSDIRAQKAVVMKEIEERLKKLSDAPPAGDQVPEELQAEAEKLEKDKERLARLDKKMAKRFSRALRKAEPGGENESSDEESTCQPPVKYDRRKSSGTLKLPELPDDEDGIQGQRLTRKVTKRFFFPEEASSVVQPEIIETLVPDEPEDIYTKNILAQRQTVKMRNTLKKVTHINQRKSSASDLEIPANLLSDKLCDVDVTANTILKPPDEDEDETRVKPVKGPGSTSASGKKKKYVKKVGDPPAKRVPGNILQPLVVPPRDSDSILESPTEEEKEEAEQAKRKPVEKVNGLVNKGQLGLKSPFLKNNFVGKQNNVGLPNTKINNTNKLINDPPAVGVGKLPVKKAVEAKPLGGKSNVNSTSHNNDDRNNKDDKDKPVAELKAVAGAAAAAVTTSNDDKKTSQVPKEDKKLDVVVPGNDPGKLETQKDSTLVKNETVDKPNPEANKVPSNEAIKKGVAQEAPGNEKPKVLPALAKLKPKLALDNKSTSFDGIKPKLKMDNKSASFDANDDIKNNNVGKGPLVQKPLKAHGKEKTEVAPVQTKPPAVGSKPVVDKLGKKDNQVMTTPPDKTKEEKSGSSSVATEIKTNVDKPESSKITTELDKTKDDKVESGKLAADKKDNPITANTESKEKENEEAKKSTPVPKKEVTSSLKKHMASPKEQNLTPIKKTDVPDPVVTHEKPKEKQTESNIKKVSPDTDNDSLAKQDLTPVKMEEKIKKIEPKKVATKETTSGAGANVGQKKDETVAQKDMKPVQPKQEQDKSKPGVKTPPQKVAPLELKDKLGIKSPPPSPKALKPWKKVDTTEPLTSSLDSPDQKPSIPESITPLKKDEPREKVESSPADSLPNGHLSPPPSSPKGVATKPGKAHPAKSPQPGETTQKQGAVGNDSLSSAKVENLGSNTETKTNGPEKKKSDSPLIPDISKLGNLSPSPVIAENLQQKSTSDSASPLIQTKTTSDPSPVIEPNNELAGGGDGPPNDPLPNPIIQSLIRKSLKRGSPRHSSGSSISSSGSSTSTAKSESGSSTSSTLSAGSSAGSRRAPSPPVEDDSDEDRITLDKICPAKTRPKYRKYEIDDFQFLKVLGKGSFGKVLLAELKGSDSYFAIKCLKKDVVLEDDDVECTMIERKVLLMGSKHPYLCHLFCTFQTESHLFFVMEYLNGGDLMFHIQQSGRFTEERARFYGAEIVSGLKFLHKRGVIYRDLKLDNILLDYEGHIRIADFGMCKLQIYLDRMADTFCGTPDYMAPEIIRGLRYNQCVDWWAFGVLMYEMLIGQSPFSGHDEDELFWSVCNEPVHYPRFLSKESKRLLELLLEKDASKRLGTVGCIHGDVKEQPFFQPIDWERLERRDLEPPFKPKLKHSLDVQYFDTTFTKEAARLTPVDKEILRSMDQTQFEGFSYTNPHTTD